MAVAPNLSEAETRVRLRAIGLACLAVVLFAGIDVSAKYAAQYVPVLEVVWARYTLGLLFAVIALRPWKYWSEYATHRPGMQVLRGTFLFVSTVLNFFAISYMPLADAVSIAFAAPLLVTALSGPILGEWAGPRRLVAVVVGFIGVLIVVQPTPDAFQPASLFAVGTACGIAGYFLTTRSLSVTETASGMLIYGTAVGALLVTPVLPFVATVPPDWLVALALAMTGITAGLGHYVYIHASRDAPATVLAPFTYTQIVWMAAGGYLVFGEVPGLPTIIGASIIIGSGLYILYRERVHHDR